MNENIDKNLNMKSLDDSELAQVSGGELPPIEDYERYVKSGPGASDWNNDKLPAEPGNYKLNVDVNINNLK